MKADIHVEFMFSAHKHGLSYHLTKQTSANNGHVLFNKT